MRCRSYSHGKARRPLPLIKIQKAGGHYGDRGDEADRDLGSVCDRFGVRGLLLAPSKDPYDQQISNGGNRYDDRDERGTECRNNLVDKHGSGDDSAEGNSRFHNNMLRLSEPFCNND